MNQEVIEYIENKIKTQDELIAKARETDQSPTNIVHLRAKKEAYIEIYNYLKDK